MMSSKQEVKKLFSGRVTEWAASYSDPEPQTLEAQNLLSRQRLALEMVEAAIPPGSKVLDVGCGTGEMAAKLMQRGYEVWGLDIAEPMIRYARYHWGSDRFQVGDIENIPFADNSFDAVVCLGVIEYQQAGDGALREIWRVLKPGGRAVVSSPNAICPLQHIDRMLVGLEDAARPLYYFVKYQLRGRRAPVYRRPPEVINKKYYRGRWLSLLRSLDLQPEELVCHGWGWYMSRLGHVAGFLSRKAKLVRAALERLFGRESVSRARDGFVRNRALNWLASEQLVRMRAVK